MMKPHKLVIPYRLKTPEDISEAMRLNLVTDGKDYEEVLELEQKIVLFHPPALLKAKEKISKQFIRIRDEKISDANTQYKNIIHFDPIDQFPMIHRSIPWCREVVAHGNIFPYIRSLPPQVRDLCLAGPFPDSPTGMFETILNLRKLLKQEMLCYIKTRKTRHLNTEQLKQLLVAGTLFDVNNDDILQALRNESAGNADQGLQQNALAELLFARLPDMMKNLLFIDSKAIRQKLFSKIAKLGMTNSQRANLHAYYKTYVPSDDIIPILNRMDVVMKKMPLLQETKTAFHDYLSSLKAQIEAALVLHCLLFLNKELVSLQKLHIRKRVMTSHVSFTERVMSFHTVVTTLDLYPTKDFMDFFKGKISNDCTGARLGKEHLSTPNFFNIRIFQSSGQDSHWIGNIYMLDFSERYRSLLIDHIQIPRGLNALYYGFCTHLKDALVEMFADVDYQYLLIPLRISNHGTVQTAFHQYRNSKRLPKKVIHFMTPYTEFFESLGSSRNYYVFHEKK